MWTPSRCRHYLNTIQTLSGHNPDTIWTISGHHPHTLQTLSGHLWFPDTLWTMSEHPDTWHFDCPDSFQMLPGYSLSSHHKLNNFWTLGHWTPRLESEQVPRHLMFGQPDICYCYISARNKYACHILHMCHISDMFQGLIWEMYVQAYSTYEVTGTNHVSMSTVHTLQKLHFTLLGYHWTNMDATLAICGMLSSFHMDI